MSQRTAGVFVDSRMFFGVLVVGSSTNGQRNLELGIWCKLREEDVIGVSPRSGG